MNGRLFARHWVWFSVQLLVANHQSVQRHTLWWSDMQIRSQNTSIVNRCDTNLCCYHCLKEMCLFYCDDGLVFYNSAFTIACTYRQQLLQSHNEVLSASSTSAIAPPFGQGGNWKESRPSFLSEEEKKQGGKSQEKWLPMIKQLSRTENGRRKTI